MDKPLNMGFYKTLHPNFPDHAARLEMVKRMIRLHLDADTMKEKTEIARQTLLERNNHV